MRIMQRILRHESGFTIVEIICALVIFFTGCLFLFKMFHLAIWSSGSISDDTMACIIARKKMEALRAWTYEKVGGVDNFSGGDWAALNGSTETDPDYPKFRITTYNELKQLNTPSSSIQPQRALLSSARAIKVEVAWTTGCKDKKFDLVTILGEPRRELAAVNIYPNTPVELDPLADQTFTAEGVDESGNVINDLVYRWYPRPESATGTLQSQVGPSIVFSNYIKIKGDPTAQRGTCRVSSGTQSGGVEMYGYSDQITLYTPE